MQIQVCFITGVTYLGIPLNGSVLQQVSNAAACQSICVSTPSCTHFTWFFLGGKGHWRYGYDTDLREILGGSFRAE